MTTAEQFRAAADREHRVLIAGVPWPLYKVVALVVGVLVLGVVALVTGSAAAAVLSAAAVSTLAWVGAGLRVHQPHRR